MINSFLQLRDMEMQEFRDFRQEEVRDVVQSRVRAGELIGEVVELFFPKLADTLSVMLGGEAIDGQDDYPTIKEHDPAFKHRYPPVEGPGDRDEIIR